MIFEYTRRGRNWRNAEGADLAKIIEDRDRELEDYLHRYVTPLDQTWRDWTPDITAATTDPTIDSTPTGRYQLLGTTCHATALIIPGASATDGSGRYRVTFPVPVSSNHENPDIIGHGTVRRNTNEIVFIGIRADGLITIDGTYGDSNGHWGTGIVFGFAAVEQMTWNLTYEIDLA